jgi:lipopolysaccharide exporter
VTPVLLLAFVAPAVFRWVFGTGWGPSGEYLRALVPWFLVAGPFVPLSQVFLVLERQKEGLRFQAALVAAALVTLMGGARWMDAPSTILAFAATGALVRLAAIEWVVRAAGGRRWDATGVFAREVARSVPYLLVPSAAVLLAVPAAATAAVVGVLIGTHLMARMRESRSARGVGDDRGSSSAA